MTPQQLLCKVLIDTNILIDYLEDCDHQKALIIFSEIEKYQEHPYVSLIINHFTYLETLEVRKKEYYMQHMVYEKNVSIKRANTNANELRDIDVTILNQIIKKVEADLIKCTRDLDILGDNASETLLALREEVEYLLKNTTLSYKDSLIVAYAKLLSINYIISGDSQLIRNEKKFLNDALSNAGIERTTYPYFTQAEIFSSIEDIYFKFFQDVLSKEQFFQVGKVYPNLFTIGLLYEDSPQECPFVENKYIYVYKKDHITINQFKILEVRFHTDHDPTHNLTLRLEPLPPYVIEPCIFNKQTSHGYVFLATL